MPPCGIRLFRSALMLVLTIVSLAYSQTTMSDNVKNDMNWVQVVRIHTTPMWKPKGGEVYLHESETAQLILLSWKIPGGLLFRLFGMSQRKHLTLGHGHSYMIVFDTCGKEVFSLRLQSWNMLLWSFWDHRRMGLIDKKHWARSPWWIKCPTLFEVLTLWSSLGGVLLEMKHSPLVYAVWYSPLIKGRSGVYLCRLFIQSYLFSIVFCAPLFQTPAGVCLRTNWSQTIFRSPATSGVCLAWILDRLCERWQNNCHRPVTVYNELALSLLCFVLSLYLTSLNWFEQNNKEKSHCGQTHV